MTHLPALLAAALLALVGCGSPIERVARETSTEAPGTTTAARPSAPPDSRPSSRRPRLLVVAAALVLVLAGVGLVARGVLRSDDQTVAAEASLSSEGLDGAAPATGRAELIRVDARRVLDISVPGVRAEDGTVLEVWLIDPASDGLQSLGTIVDDAGPTRLPVPEAIDVDRFSVVDVSLEPLDGDPAHSADSVVRGNLAPT